MNKIYLDGDTLVTITQRCNLNCAHCFRDQAQAQDMTKQVIDAFLDKASGFKGLTISGGEPTLAANLIAYLVDGIIKRNIVTFNVNMVINGTQATRNPIVTNAFNRLSDYTNSLLIKLAAHKKDESILKLQNETIVIAISNDYFHRAAGVTKEEQKATYDYYRAHCPHVNIKHRTYDDMSQVVGVGRAERLYGFYTAPALMPTRITPDKDMSAISFDMLSLMPNGDIIPMAHIPHNYQDRPNDYPVITNVRRHGSLFDEKTLSAWNMKHPFTEDMAEIYSSLKGFTIPGNREWYSGEIDRLNEQLTKDRNGLEAFADALSAGDDMRTAWKEYIPSLSFQAKVFAKKLINDPQITVDTFITSKYQTIFNYIGGLAEAEKNYSDFQKAMEHLTGIVSKMQKDWGGDIPSITLLSLFDKAICIMEASSEAERAQRERLWYKEYNKAKLLAHSPLLAALNDLGEAAQDIEQEIASAKAALSKYEKYRNHDVYRK